MSSTRQTIEENHEHQQVQPKRGMARKNNAYKDRMKKCVALVGFLGALVGSIATIRQIIPPGPENGHIKILTDDQLKIVRVDEDQYELQLAITLTNEGQKPDTIRRPHVTFTSDMPVVVYSHKVVFTDNREGADALFPLALQKESSAHITCIIGWKPSPDYYRWISEESREAEKIGPAVRGYIDLTWPGNNQKRTARPFAWLAAETIREMQPGVPQTVSYLYLNDENPDDEEEATRSAMPSALLFGAQGPAYQVAGIETGGEAHIAPIGTRTSPTQATKSHYAAQGEIASGKEVPSSNPGELIVNIRPCGGASELVIFKAQFKKRLLGMLPCGVQMVQVQKL